MALVELHAIFSGKVQGVGFRWTVVDKAQDFGVNGFVRNVPNGTVEMVAQGEKKVLEALLEAIKSDSGAARIETVNCQYKAVKNAYLDFQMLV